MKKALIFCFVLFSLYACHEPKIISIKTISQEEFSKLDLNTIQLLDVRTPAEVDHGLIDGAVEVNFFDEDFAQQVLSKFDKSKPLYIYCAVGGRSGKACSQLVLEGFREVYNLKGGYNEWIKNQKQ